MIDATSPAGPERARWPRVAGAPHPQLRSVVAREYAGYVEATTPRQLIVPATASVPLIVKLRDSAHRPPAFARGVHGEHSVVQGPCAPSYIEAWLAPLGAYTLLGLPMDALRGQIVDLADLLGADGRRTAERLREAATWGSRYALMDELLLRRLDDGPRPSPEVVRAWQVLVATDGAVRIRRLADEVGWSHRHLVARFTQQIGLTPKRAARLCRFDAALRRLDDRRPPRWEWIAAESGYADQPHLVREFREFAGTTPTDFLARTAARRRGEAGVNSVQDGFPARS